MTYYTFRQQAVKALIKLQRKGKFGRIRYTWRQEEPNRRGWWIEEF